MNIALTRAVSQNLGKCELTYLERQTLDIDKAKSQHREYERNLEKIGFSIRRLPETPDFPDSVFVEDTAIILPEICIITNPGADSRKPEIKSVASVLKEYHRLGYIKFPGTMDGGDVIVAGSTLFVGLSGRTNKEGVRQLSEMVRPYGYLVSAVPVQGCLHLKTAVSVVEQDLLLVNPGCIDSSYFEGFTCVSVHREEPSAVNIIRHKNRVLCQKVFPRTMEWLDRSGYEVYSVDFSEFAKAEAGLSCCSLLMKS
jgi:dimethylargininase